MLSIHKNPQFDFPHSVRRSVQHKFALSPVIAEEDELLDEINQDSANQWDLVDQSGEELESFWNTVLSDVRKDPEWYNFSNDD